MYLIVIGGRSQGCVQTPHVKRAARNKPNSNLRNIPAVQAKTIKTQNDRSVFNLIS